MFASSGGLCTDHGKVTKKYRLFIYICYCVWTMFLWINMMIIIVTSSLYSYRRKA